MKTKYDLYIPHTANTFEKNIKTKNNFRIIKYRRKY